MAEKIVVWRRATGQGHVGLLAWQAGFDIVFVDKKTAAGRIAPPPGRYTVKIYGEETQEIAVSGYRVYPLRWTARRLPTRFATPGWC